MCCKCNQWQLTINNWQTSNREPRVKSYESEIAQASQEVLISHKLFFFSDVALTLVGAETLVFDSAHIFYIEQTTLKNRLDFLQRFLGNLAYCVLLLPIPNRIVKVVGADDTSCFGGGESKLCREFIGENLGGFLIS